jgi:hypothetical protein
MYGGFIVVEQAVGLDVQETCIHDCAAAAAAVQHGSTPCPVLDFVHQIKCELNKLPLSRSHARMLDGVPRGDFWITIRSNLGSNPNA